MVTAVAEPTFRQSDPLGGLLSILRINGGVVVGPATDHQSTYVRESLTKREREVLSLVAEGYSNKLIAANLDICERTVKNHLASVMTKLRANDRTDAVVIAVRLGLAGTSSPRPPSQP